MTTTTTIQWNETTTDSEKSIGYCRRFEAECPKELSYGTNFGGKIIRERLLLQVKTDGGNNVQYSGVVCDNIGNVPTQSAEGLPSIEEIVPRVLRHRANPKNNPSFVPSVADVLKVMGATGMSQGEAVIALGGKP